jgi:hypothetical protein
MTISQQTHRKTPFVLKFSDKKFDLCQSAKVYRKVSYFVAFFGKPSHFVQLFSYSFRYFKSLNVIKRFLSFHKGQTKA